jgi:hypothetical protein
MLSAAVGLGAIVGSPGTAVAQEDTTSTTSADETTETTVDESTEQSGEADRPARGDHDCGDRAGEGSTGDSSTEEATSSQT